MQRQTIKALILTTLISTARVTTEMNIALGKPAFMSSDYGFDHPASSGNDGDKTTHFHTAFGNEAWWGVDFGEERALVTGVYVTNIDNDGQSGRLLNFTVGLTDQDPRTGNGPLKSPFLKCAKHGGMGTGETISLTCTPPLYGRRRYLFVAATVDSFFHLNEIEVFAATEPIVASATGFREFGKCDVFTDNNRTTCGAVTSPDNPLDFLLRANFSQPQTHFHPRITLRGGNCGDASQVHVYTEEKPLNAGPFDGYFRRCQVSETEPSVDGVTVCSFACVCIERACDVFGVRVFGQYGPERSLCEIELIFN